MIPAIYANGRIVTGSNHGEAYGKLTEEEKNNVQSGFIDAENLKFICENGKNFYLKKMIMIRHADAIENHITQIGRNQAKLVAAYLLKMHIQEYKILSSPINRCNETAQEISEYCQIEYEQHKCLVEQEIKETYQHFTDRIKSCVTHLPEKSLLISHCDFIQTMTKLIVGELPESNIPFCGSIFIDNHKIIWYGKKCDDKYFATSGFISIANGYSMA